MTAIDYIGDELSLFEAAHNWKAYLRAKITPLISGDVAEVGAGLGATSRALSGGEGVRSWLCIEPDKALFDQLSSGGAGQGAAHPITFLHGRLGDLPATPALDTILYIDVLEHIEDDATELIVASDRLRLGGKLIVLCPAFQSVYSPFDKAIGHFRRYTLRTLRAAAPPDLRVRKAYYLDSVGLLTSFANKMLLRQSMPTKRQVAFWDSVIVPVSRFLDIPCGRLFGKSVVVVWEKR